MADEKQESDFEPTPYLKLMGVGSSWEKKLAKEISDRRSFWDAPPEPPLTWWQRVRRNLAYHLFHRWKTLRFGFYRRCSCREEY